MRGHCEITDEDDRWMTYADKEILMIDRDIRQENLEASTVLKCPKPSYPG